MYKTKNIKKEDKYTYRKACALIGRRVLRAEQEKQKRKQSMEQDDGDDLNSTDDTNAEQDDLSKEIEGLGRILTGTYAMCS